MTSYFCCIVDLLNNQSISDAENCQRIAELSEWLAIRLYSLCCTGQEDQGFETFVRLLPVGDFPFVDQPYVERLPHTSEFHFLCYFRLRYLLISNFHSVNMKSFYGCDAKR